MVVMERTSVHFWLDPLCPWSWLTSQWLLEVQAHVDVEVRWGVMSLAVLNEGTDIPDEWRPFLEGSWAAVRALEGARQSGGDEAFVAFLGALGDRYHVEERRDLREVIAESVRETGCPDEIAVTSWTDVLDEDVRLSHKRAMALGGSDVGSPILGFEGPEGMVGFYGPILSRVPRGEDAVRVFDAVRTMATTPGFFELKRTRDEEPWLV